jgi:hypothetical protein
MKSRSSVAICLLLGLAASSYTYGQTTFSLRAADEPTPDKKQWDQGAAIAYQATNGEATVQSDAAAKFGYVWLHAGTTVPGQKPFEAGSTAIELKAGPYWHKFTGGKVPVSDRGVSIGLSAHGIPGGAADGPVIDFDYGVNFTAGKTLKEGSDALKGQYFSVDSKRIVGSAALYYQPKGGFYFRLSGGPYMDDVSNSPTAKLNGRESGLQAAAQLSIYPLGMVSNKNTIGDLGVAPILTFKAQKQFDSSASENRLKRDYTLYSVALSFPFVLNNADQSGFVPSLDIKRSIGADLLTGRARNGVTSISLSIKY